MRAVIITGFLAGCSSESASATSDAASVLATRCTMLEGRMFATVDMQTCYGPGGSALCHFDVTFSGQPTGTYWTFHGYSDVGEGGAITCDAGAITSVIRDRYTHTAQYLDDVDHLLWDDVEYSAP